MADRLSAFERDVLAAAETIHGVEKPTAEAPPPEMMEEQVQPPPLPPQHPNPLTRNSGGATPAGVDSAFVSGVMGVHHVHADFLSKR